MDDDCNDNNDAMEVVGEPDTLQAIGNRSILASVGSVSSIEVQLHPLVILTISDHWTRRKAQEGKEKLIIGALIGKQNGRQVEVMKSFELDFNVIDDDVVIYRDFYNKKESHFKQVFSTLEFLGWYTTGDRLSENHIKIHKQFCEINECPIFLILDPTAKHTSELPVSIYESVIDIVNGEAQMLFVPLTYTVTTEEAERIGIDHIARLSSNSASSGSSVVEQLSAQYCTIKMLYSRVKIIVDYLKAVQRKELNENHDILREVYALRHRLPVIQTGQFKQEFLNQNNEVNLLTLLGIMTKGCYDMNNLITTLIAVHDDVKSSGRQLRSGFFTK